MNGWRGEATPERAACAVAGALSRLADWACASHGRAALLLVLVSLGAFLPGQFRLPPIDRDEPRYAQATTQMMETGNYLDIRYQEVPRYLQPAGAYWMQAAAAHLTGTAPHAPIWVHRLPSLAGATAGVLLTYWVALPLAGNAGALIAALFMAASILLGFEARLAKTDALLLVSVLAAIGVMARAYLRVPGLPGSWRWPMLFWAAHAAGLLTKGPLILLVVGSTAAALAIWDRSASWIRALRPWPGVALMLALVLPWVVAITVSSGGEFLAIALGKSMLGKVASGQQSHGAPPGTYLLVYWATFWPAAGLALIAAPWAWRRRADPAVRFCLAWIVPTWIVFELIVTKLPHYVLPVYPAIAILMARALLDGRMPGRVLGWLLVAAGLAYALAGHALYYAIEGRVSAVALALGAVALAVLVLPVRRERRPVPFALALTGVALLLHGATFGVLIPQFTTLWISPRLAAAVARQASCAQPQVASAGYHEPSLVFLVGTQTRLVFAPEAAAFLRVGGCRLALVERREEAEFHARAGELGMHPVLRERVTGYNIGNGRTQDIAVYAPGT